MRILFICKHNESYGQSLYKLKTSGLYNSTSFIVRALNRAGVEAKLIEVQDNNSIDKEVAHYRPDRVVIEALWVVPNKFDILKKLHPHVQWYVHLHSHAPFLALEGIAMEWIAAYELRGVGVITNSEPAYKALKGICSTLYFLPNVYLGPRLRKPLAPRASIHVGCFGAVRPMKNQLLQALAALEFAKQHDRFLVFHINATRAETNGEPVLKNLRALFELQARASLFEHPWYDPHDFINVLHDFIDVAMQVSLSETFNVVTADAVAAGVPVVVSDQIPWASWASRAQSDSIDSIVKTMGRVWKSECLVKRNQSLLNTSPFKAQHAWLGWAS